MQFIISGITTTGRATECLEYIPVNIAESGMGPREVGEIIEKPARNLAQNYLLFSLKPKVKKSGGSKNKRDSVRSTRESTPNSGKKSRNRLCGQQLSSFSVWRDTAKK